MRHLQKGFAAQEGLLILIIIAIIGGTGWYVLHSKNSANSVYKAADKVSSEQPVTSYDDFVSVAQKDGTDLWKTPKQAATTADQQAILTTIFKDKCDSTGNVGISYLTFTNTELFKQDGNYAYINSGCTNRTHDPNKQDGGGAAYFLHKNKKGEWMVDGLTQSEGPSCKAIDNKGYPASIVPKCFDESGSLRSPK